MEDHGPQAETAPAPEPVILGPKEERREKSDRRMLRAAIALIAQHGSVGASLAQIGLDAGYSRGLPAQRFGTKLKLLETVADVTAEHFDRLVAEATAGKRGCEALAARIRAQMEAVRRSPEAATAVYHLMVDAIGSVPELKPRIAMLHEGYRRSIRKHVLEARQMGELREGVDVEETVRAIQGVISGLCLQALIAGDAERLSRDAEVAAGLLIEGIRKTS
ncbi:TetR family transcriptional regulator C-terminal domain-containing protein [Albimonas sp. CAU 1670]|uniref:TetR/AcrR family transcriptional regulator n=1 Tax=Albimonas sp. CAU 1670 TaxID=3032599 RepID=UPI0023D9B28C|nr:TetR family transcriptional regulator C-terminal domain-containing protein [Albimonas sp. CAU 1670]MDF2234118.1 TetR family transcriptional regulator C-terminal domain-containing protein [Albimonas sp. CAU 1670]